jgi:membrane protease YdiL (CAAX protease family)
MSEAYTGGAPRRDLFRTAVFFYLALMLVPLWWKAASEGPDLFYPEGFSWADTIGSLVTGTLAGLLVVWLSGVAMRRSRWGRTLRDNFARVLGPLRLRDAWALAFLSALGEEMFFRGLLQPRLGLPITSVLFGLVHFVPRREMLPWTLFSIAAGFLLGGLYAFAGTLVAPIACHLVVNGINLARIARSAPAAQAV